MNILNNKKLPRKQRMELLLKYVLSLQLNNRPDKKLKALRANIDLFPVNKILIHKGISFSTNLNWIRQPQRFLTVDGSWTPVSNGEACIFTGFHEAPTDSNRVFCSLITSKLETILITLNRLSWKDNSEFFEFKEFELLKEEEE